MNSSESQLEYPFNDQLPAPGQVIKICDGVYWIQMRLPFVLNHINLWLLEDGAGWTIIDCGIDKLETRDDWERIFAQFLNGKPVTRVLVTHCHPDHLGLAHWLCERWQVMLWMSAGEYAFGRVLSASLPGVDGASLVKHFQRHGVTDPTMVEKLLERKDHYSSLVPHMPLSYVRLSDQQIVTIGAHDWQVIAGYGHSPEHVALYCKALNILISGDMLLPRISTNISVWANEPLGNPLEQFLTSLNKFDVLPSDTLVLPSHGKPFCKHHLRIEQLRKHHKERLAEVEALCAKPMSAKEIVPFMFTRPLDTHQLSFALGEALAHCHYLWNRGKLTRQTDTDGVIRFMANPG